MPIMTSTRLVVAGADTHSQPHHVAVLKAVTGTWLGDRQFLATTAGYRQVVALIAGLKERSASGSRAA